MDKDLEKVDELKDVVISALAQTMVIYGVTPSVGRIYGVLYFSKKPMSLDEIKEAIAMSKGSVSTGLRELLETEMIIKVWKKGDRKDHYIAEKDFVKNFISFFVKNIRLERNMILKANHSVLPQLKEIVNTTKSNELKEEITDNIKLIEDSLVYCEWTRQLTDAMETGKLFEYFPVQNKKEEK